jgi:ribosomal protein L6P/L9E
MVLGTILQLNNMVNKKFIIKSDLNNNMFLILKTNKKLLVKIKFANNVVFTNNFIFTLSNSLKFDNYLSFVRLINTYLEKEFYEKYKGFAKLHMIGLGFKNFILKNSLYILVGDCNYVIFYIPLTLKVFCKKNQIYVLGNNELEIFNFISNIKKVKKSNFYKGKGILQFRNFKFTKLKVGKKQRFM